MQKQVFSFKRQDFPRQLIVYNLALVQIYLPSLILFPVAAKDFVLSDDFMTLEWEISYSESSTNHFLHSNSWNINH